MEVNLRNAKLKKAKLLEQMSMLSSVSDHFLLQLGKVEYEILNLERELVRKTKNPLDD